MKNKLIIVIVCAISINLGSLSMVAYASDYKVDSIIEENNSDAGTIIPPVTNIESKKVIIKSVTIDKDRIEPGIPFTITYRVENISDGEIDGLSLKLSSLEGKSTLEGFMPVGTTNEIYVGSIGYKEVRDVSITLCSNPNVKTGNYNFQTSIIFSQWGGDREEITAISGVMLKSTPVIKLSRIESNGSNVMGTLINDDSTKIKNINIKVKVGDKEYEEKISSIDSESEERFKVYIEATKSEQEATIEVTYEDISGSQYKKEGKCKVIPMITEEEVSNKKEKPGLFGFVRNLFRFVA